MCVCGKSGKKTYENVVVDDDDEDDNVADDDVEDDEGQGEEVEMILSMAMLTRMWMRMLCGR